jgi:hypothetical protein
MLSQAVSSTRLEFLCMYAKSQKAIFGIRDDLGLTGIKCKTLALFD